MRITQNMLSQSALNGMQTNLRRLSDLQRKAVTTKRVSRPEDDPFAVEQGLGFRARIKASETARHNISMSRNWLGATDKALGDVGDLLIRSRSLATQGANDALGAEERQSISIEVDQILEEMVAISNTRHGDDYIFSGFDINSPAYQTQTDPITGQVSAVAVAASNINGQIIREVEPGIDMVVNVPGDTVFNNSITNSTGGIFQSLIGLRDDLVNNPSNVTNRISELQADLDTVLDVQAAVGTKLRRLDSVSARMEATEVGMRELLSKNEDADMAEVVSDLTQQKFIYETALAVNGQVLRTSLLDFIR